MSHLAFGLQGKGQQALAERLPKSIGWGMGLEFRESQLQLIARNAVAARAGMVFNVTLGAQQRLLCSQCVRASAACSAPAPVTLPEQQA